MPLSGDRYDSRVRFMSGVLTSVVIGAAFGVITSVANNIPGMLGSGRPGSRFDVGSFPGSCRCRAGLAVSLARQVQLPLLRAEGAAHACAQAVSKLLKLFSQSIGSQRPTVLSSPADARYPAGVALATEA